LPVEREITLRDYGRVLWSGRWVLLVAAVGAALIGLLVSLARETEYTSSSIVYLGLATTAGTGVPVSTPFTTPATAQKVLAADEFIQRAADASGVDPERVRDGVSFSVERIPGAVGGNQPTVATITYTDPDRPTSIKVTNAYADGVFGYVEDYYKGVFDAYRTTVENRDRRIAEITSSLNRLRAQANPNDTLLVSLQQELATVQFSADEATVALAKTKQIEQPRLISKATSASSSARPGQRLRSVVFGAILGLILGAIVVFIWKGSPTGRADDA
jgi:uncharacterized protein involved in exopolysaccharide biosynthesis